MVRTVLLLVVSAAAVFGQGYGFEIPEYYCRAEVNRNRSLTLHYEIRFKCSVGRRSIDIVDIGFPSSDYKTSSATASVNDVNITAIYPSTYIENGVEVHLVAEAIAPGKTGLFRFRGVCGNMVFLDTEKEGYASVEFSPTWFDGEILSGESSFTLEMVFPPGAEPQDVYHHDEPFTDAYVDSSGRVVYVWQTFRRVDSPYTVGISFPARLVTGTLTERPRPPLVSTGTLIVILIFFGSFLFVVFIAFIIVRSIRRSRRRLEEYLPPEIGLEGSAVKRGLTAPMAALLLEEKLDRVFLMIIFGLMKKGALTLEGDRLVKTGTEDGLRFYEKALLDDLLREGTVSSKKVEKIFLSMIEKLEEKMENYSLEKTREYYRSIIDSAWRMVEADQSASRVGQMLGDRYQWLLADEEFESRIEDLPEDRAVSLPRFMTPFFSGGKGTVSLSSACSEIAGFLETVSGRVVSNITDLSKSVTTTTNPVPVSSYSGRSGSSCACACACAGCACACAGGGR